MAKKIREPSPASAASASDAEDVKVTSPDSGKKRKRNVAKDDEDDLEIDVTLPEPPSKKAARKAKKAKTKPESTNEDGTTTTTAEEKKAHPGRTVHGIWVGNLPFTADKDVVRVFFTRQGQIPDIEITRIHMPVPTHAQPGRVKPNNKGFAYIDFNTKESLDKAIALSESLMTGRKVLIKNANSFEGRPEKATATANALSGVTDSADAVTGAEVKGKDGKPAKPAFAASQRIFVGNLSFDTTKDDLENHFIEAGEMEDIHMATFQDTGKCKGFAWIRFKELEAAQAAVQGFVFKDEPKSDDEDDDDEEMKDASSGESDSDDEDKPSKAKAKKSKKQKKRKWFLNRLQGRTLRCEFAEDSQSRYKKRFGKDRPRDGEEGAAPIAEADGEAKPRAKPKGDKDARQAQRRQRHIDARNIAPGAALANAPRASGAIVEAKGKKTKFE